MFANSVVMKLQQLWEELKVFHGELGIYSQFGWKMTVSQSRQKVNLWINKSEPDILA
jgi:hypothetical protein